MTKFAKIKNCLYNIYKCHRFLAGFSLAVLIVRSPQLFKISADPWPIIWLIAYTLTSLYVWVRVEQYYWPKE